MALDGEDGIVARHPAAVVAHANGLAAAVFDREVDRRGAGVEGILDQLLDDGCRTLDDLARRDLIGDGARQYGDAWRGATGTVRS